MKFMKKICVKSANIGFTNVVILNPKLKRFSSHRAPQHHRVSVLWAVSGGGCVATDRTAIVIYLTLEGLCVLTILFVVAAMMCLL